MSTTLFNSPAPTASVESAAPHALDRYRPAIDGLRAIAVLAVFFFHLDRKWLSGGFVGVDVFFVISGYLITSILVRGYEKGRFALSGFYQRRIARLLPAFFTAGFVTLIASLFIYLDRDLASCGLAFATAALSVANMKFIFEGNYFVVLPDAHALLHYWSLSVEEQFYMVFPLGLLIVYRKAKKSKLLILSIACALSLIACVFFTYSSPTLAFYLLPTRAWELLAGSILANLNPVAAMAPAKKAWSALAPVGLVLIAASLLLLRESAEFPGYLATLPVLGTILVIGRNGAANPFLERFLSAKPLVFIGKMSYSLYLWHWPVFALVDYRFYQASSLVRLALKIGLSFFLSALCFFWIESRGRIYFNRPDKKRLAFVFLAATVIFSYAFGMAVRNDYYLDVSRSAVASGGVVVNPSGKTGSIFLMGDSNGAMYGRTIREIAKKLGYRLVLISVNAADPLPHSSGEKNQLWLDSLNAVKRQRPDVLILICEWKGKLKNDQGRLASAVKDLQPYTHHLILITEPPALPKTASREAIRQGSKPPFFEEPNERAALMESNALVKKLAGPNVTVIDIDDLFVDPSGVIHFTDQGGHQLYGDPTHLSGFGTDLVKRAIRQAIVDSKHPAA